MKNGGKNKRRSVVIPSALLEPYGRHLELFPEAGLPFSKYIQNLIQKDLLHARPRTAAAVLKAQ